MIPDGTFTLARAKAHLRVPHTDEDALIGVMLDAAVGQVESITRRAWTARAWSVAVDACDAGTCCTDPAVFHAELSPATAKVYGIASGVDTELPALDYYMATRFGASVVVVKTWPTHSGEGQVARIDFAAAPPDNYVPPDIYAAVMLYLGDLYENREAQIVGTIVGQNAAAEMLTRSYVVGMHA